MVQSVPQTIKNRLLPGETVLWSGRAGRGLMFQPSDWFALPFGLIWTAIVVSNVVAVARSPASSGEAVIFVVPFILIGGFFLIGRHAIDAWLRGRMVYCLTDQRVLIERAGPFGNFLSFNLDGLPGLSMSERSGGRGTLRFGQQIQMWGRMNGTGMGGFIAALDPIPQFLGIDDVERVFVIAQEHMRPQTGT